MKKRKGILLCGLATLFGLTMASCQSVGMDVANVPQTDSSTTAQQYNPELIDMSTQLNTGRTLSSITVSGDNSSYVYELGSKFDASRYSVTANYVKFVDGSPKAEKETLATGFYYDYSNVDFAATGSYPVFAYYREKTKIVSTQFNISVKSTEVVESGKEYLAGLQIITNAYTTGQESNPNAITILRDTTYTRPAFTATGHVYVGEEEVRTRTINARALVIDDSSVDTTKEGIYYIKISYDNSGNTNGLSNIVTSFIVVQVINPIQEIEFASGTLEFSATASKLDTSSWKMYFKKQVGQKELVNFDDYDFTLTGINTLVAGEYDGTISFVNPSNKKQVFTCDVKVKIVESQTSTIVSYLSFGDFMPVDYLENDSADTVPVYELTKLGENGRVVLAKNPAGVGVIYANFSGSSGIDEHKPAKEATGFDIEVTCRYKLGGAGSASTKNIEVVLPSKGVVVIYFASASAGVERYLQMLDSNGQRIEDAVCSTGTYAKAVFNVESAGTYYFVSQSSGINIYAVIASYENV